MREPDETPKADACAGDDRCAGDVVLVRAFVRRHFSLRGTIRLHRASLGSDLLRAPVNICLAPIFLLVRLAALILGALRFRKASRWLGARRILLRTDIAGAVERALIAEVLGPRAPPGTPISPAARNLVEDYVSVRNAVAEIVTTCIVLGCGLLLFRVATPGVLSLAPVVSDEAARSIAVSSFPMGRWFGEVWYGVFQVDRSGFFVAGVTLLLLVAASAVSTFAGVLADPLQARLGLHRRRLLRLLVKFDRAETARSTIAREHLLARLADLADAATALLRFLRP